MKHKGDLVATASTQIWSLPKTDILKLHCKLKVFLVTYASFELMGLGRPWQLFYWRT